MTTFIAGKVILYEIVYFHIKISSYYFIFKFKLSGFCWMQADRILMNNIYFFQDISSTSSSPIVTIRNFSSVAQMKKHKKGKV